MKSMLLPLFSMVFVAPLIAQDTLRISRDQAETIFLQNNLLLISEQLQIEQQKAEVIQAKLWPNPSFSINEVNLWATDKQTAGQEVSPPFWGNFGRNQQVGFEIEQLIQTSGKRKKRIALEQLEVYKAEQYFEELLRGLKLELRNQLTALQYTQYAIGVHKDLAASISKLTSAYKNQLEQNNISKSQYIRLKAQELEINKEILALNTASREIQTALKLLLRADPRLTLSITNDGFIRDASRYTSVFIDEVLETAKQNRPDYKMALLEEEYSNKILAYEKAQRTPDMTFGVNYDRNGNTMLDFVGFGLSFDLPFFNRNKGNIKKAEIGIAQAKVMTNQKVLSIENEILSAFASLQQAQQFISAIETDYESDLDKLLERYTQNFSTKNVSMLEYLDFLDAYLENKKIILEAQKELNQKTEEFIYTLAKDLYN